MNRNAVGTNGFPGRLLNIVGVQIRIVGQKILCSHPRAQQVQDHRHRIFVSGTQQVGKFKIIIRQQNVGEVLNEVDQRAVIECSLAHSPIEIDAFQNILQRIRIGIFYGSQSFVQT